MRSLLDGLRVVFMGTPDFAVPTLEAVIGAGASVLGVVSQPGRPQGRGLQVAQTPVGAVAEAHGLALFQWPRLNNDSYATLRALAPEVMVVVAYGKILPQRYLDLPPLGCVNGHASLLPALRGAAPIQRAIMAGHSEAGVSIMRMEAGMDTGPVGRVGRLAIGPDETAGALHDRLSALTATEMVAALADLRAGRLEWIPQDHARATLAPPLTKEDGRIDWRATAAAVHDRVRGVSPWPGAFTTLVGEPLRVHQTRRIEAVEGGAAPGVVVAHAADGPVVACGEGAVALQVLQRAGRKAMPGDAFLRGTPLPVGHALGT